MHFFGKENMGWFLMLGFFRQGTGAFLVIETEVFSKKKCIQTAALGLRTLSTAQQREMHEDQRP